MYGIYYCEFHCFKPPDLFSGFLHSSYEKTNTSLFLGLSCLHTGTHVTRTVTPQHTECLSSCTVAV